MTDTAGGDFAPSGQSSWDFLSLCPVCVSLSITLGEGERSTLTSCLAESLTAKRNEFRTGGEEREEERERVRKEVGSEGDGRQRREGRRGKRFELDPQGGSKGAQLAELQKAGEKKEEGEEREKSRRRAKL